MADDLKQRQQAGEEVERKMLDFLMQFDAARELKVGDVKMIAEQARLLAFGLFSDLNSR